MARAAQNVTNIASLKRSAETLRMFRKRGAQGPPGEPPMTLGGDIGVPCSARSSFAACRTPNAPLQRSEIHTRREGCIGGDSG